MGTAPRAVRPPTRPDPGSAYTRRRQRLVQDLQAQGIDRPELLKAFLDTPRHLFVDEALAGRAYRDSSLPLGLGQTITQPLLVARMIQLLCLQAGDRVLEIGTGSGYDAALLSRLSAPIFTVERLAPLAQRARENWSRADVTGVEPRVGDGTLGWPEAAPFDAILVSAAAPEVPRALLDQLAPRGRMAIPVGNAFRQRLEVLTRTDLGAEVADHGPCSFVRLVGQQGFKE